MDTMYCSHALVVVLLIPLSGSDLPALQSQKAAKPVVSSDVRAGCDRAYQIASKTPGVSIRRRTGDFRDETLREPVFGCGLDISGSFAKAARTGDAASRLRMAFAADGWRELAEYSADGADGTSFAFQKARVACLARGVWNGGADDEPGTPPDDWYKVTVFCTSPPFPEHRQ